MYDKWWRSRVQGQRPKDAHNGATKEMSCNAIETIERNYALEPGERNPAQLADDLWAAEFDDAQAAQALVNVAAHIGFADDNNRPPMAAPHEGRVALILVLTAGPAWLEAFPTKTTTAACNEFLARARSFIARCAGGRAPSPRDPEAYVPSPSTRAKFPACDQWQYLGPAAQLCRHVEEQAASADEVRRTLTDQNARLMRIVEAQAMSLASERRDDDRCRLASIRLDPVPFFCEGGPVHPIAHMRAVRARAMMYDEAATTCLRVLAASLKGKEQQWLQWTIDDNNWSRTRLTNDDLNALEALFYKRFIGGRPARNRLFEGVEQGGSALNGYERVDEYLQRLADVARVAGCSEDEELMIEKARLGLTDPDIRMVAASMDGPITAAWEPFKKHAMAVDELLRSGRLRQDATRNPAGPDEATTASSSTNDQSAGEISWDFRAPAAQTTYLHPPPVHLPIASNPEAPVFGRGRR